jgi:hypothetical protein
MKRVSACSSQQGRQDSNLQPPVLETGALPVELRPSVRRPIVLAPFGYPSFMSEQADQFDERDDSDETLEEEQEDKGYGADEGERDDALPED